MSDTVNDPERTAAQVDKLLGLRDRRRRMTLLRRIAGRRPAGGLEPDGLRRAPIRLVNTLPSPRGVTLDPVLIVPGEILVPAADRDRAEALLRERELLAPDEGTDRIEADGRTAVIPVTGSVDIRTLLRMLRSADIPASANHVGALGGRSKAGSTPKRTDFVLGERTNGAVARTPLVIIVDTGLDRAAMGDALLPEDNRTDAWLDDVAVDTSLNGGIDLLDTVDYHGTAGADGFLDLGAGHGTFVAGLVRQAAQSANVVVVRALDTDGNGSESLIAAAIGRAGELFAQSSGVGLLNLSLGLETIDEDEPAGIAAAIDDLPDNVLVVAAAGNGPTGIRVWPAALAETRERVLAVASLTRGSGGLAPSTWSNFGPWVSFSAVGEGVVSTFVAGTETEGSGDEGDPFDPHPDTFDGPNAYAMWSGTSFATAKVTGILAEWLAGQPQASVGDAITFLRDDAAGGTQMANYGYVLDA